MVYLYLIIATTGITILVNRGNWGISIVATQLHYGEKHFHFTACQNTQVIHHL